MSTVASGVAKQFCGKIAILLAYDLQSKLKDFIRSINPLDDPVRFNSSGKHSASAFQNNGSIAPFFRMLPLSAIEIDVRFKLAMGLEVSFCGALSLT